MPLSLFALIHKKITELGGQFKNRFPLISLQGECLHAVCDSSKVASNFNILFLDVKLKHAVPLMHNSTKMKYVMTLFTVVPPGSSLDEVRAERIQQLLGSKTFIFKYLKLGQMQ